MYLFSYLLLFCLSFQPGKQLVYNQAIDATSPKPLHFDFGPGDLEKGYVRVLPGTLYSPEQGYGFYENTGLLSFDSGLKSELKKDYCSSEQPFYFVAKVPEGNYRVKVVMGNLEKEVVATIKAESRRLMVKEEVIPKGQFKTFTFMVNVRRKTISLEKEVKLTHREVNHFNWDDQLTLEFNGQNPSVCAIEITPVKKITTLYLIGNSTVTDQKSEPFASWGQMLPLFFKPQKIVVANHAESGESLKRFLGENRLEKLLTTLKKGDYCLIQFGHNDQKPQSGAYVAPFTDYKKYLKDYIDEIRKKGAYPVLVTSVHRRTFDDQGKIINSHGDYPEAMRQVAKEEGLPLIDLNNMSQSFFETLGPEGSKKAFVHYPAGSFPAQEKAIADDSHFSNYGAYELAKCIAKSIQEQKLGIAKFLLEDFSNYQPAQPDSVKNWTLPFSPDISFVRPEGN